MLIGWRLTHALFLTAARWTGQPQVFISTAIIG
jgi:hypothetical protein